MDTSYADHGYLFLTQSTDSHRKSNSLMGAFHCQLRAVISLSFLNVKKRPSSDSMLMFPALQYARKDEL